VDTQATLWAAILASGVYHGLNPGMGWPLAVAAGLTERRATAVARTLGPLAAGHLVSIAVVLLPFGALTVLLDWTREIRITAGLMIVGFSGVLLLYPRHPRWLARMRPTQVTLWSFTVALLHGAGLMLVPMLLGLCAPSLASGPPAPSVAANGALALVVALVHTAALVAASGLIAWAVYRALGLEMLRRSWLDLRRLWAGSLALVGALAVWSAV
jgi:type IV secretory pathway TrbD component